MEDRIKQVIELRYGITITKLMEGPRQFVAETFIIESEYNPKYFVKLIKYSKDADFTIHSLPIVDQLFKSGITNINYPIKTAADEFYVMEDGLLIVLFNYIEAIQKFGYTNEVFGKLIAEIHAKTPEIEGYIPKEDFEFIHLREFLDLFEQGVHYSGEDTIALEMQKELIKYEEEMWSDWRKFEEVMKTCQSTDFNLVLTHGDAPGNTLIDDEDNIYLIDWDTIKLAPAERDTFFLKDSESFFEAYRKVIPGYELNDAAYRYYLYERYFDDIQDFIEEILSDKSEHHREKRLGELKRDCFEEWLRPLIRALD